MEETLRDQGSERRPVATPQGEKGLKRQLAFPTPQMSSKLPRQMIDLSIDSGDEHAPYAPTEPDDDQSQSYLSDADEPGLSSVPDIGDQTAPRPKAGEVRLSRSAINSRLRRIMKPNVHGNFKVSQAVIQDFHSAKNRKNIDQIFQMCGFDTETVPKLVTVIWCLPNKCQMIINI